MDYQAEYQKKLTTAEEAVKVVKSGDWVDYSFCANHPIALDKALAERMAADPSLTDLSFRGAIALWRPRSPSSPMPPSVSPGTRGTPPASSAS